MCSTESEQNRFQRLIWGGRCRGMFLLWWHEFVIRNNTQRNCEVSVNAHSRYLPPDTRPQTLSHQSCSAEDSWTSGGSSGVLLHLSSKMLLQFGELKNNCLIFKHLSAWDSFPWWLPWWLVGFVTDHFLHFSNQLNTQNPLVLLFKLYLPVQSIVLVHHVDQLVLSNSSEVKCVPQ